MILCTLHSHTCGTRIDSYEELRNLAIDLQYVASADLIQSEEGVSAYYHVRATALSARSIDLRLQIDNLNGKPVLDLAGLAGVHGAWLVQSNTDSDGNKILKPDRAVLIGKEVLAQCDSADGSEDGIISDPRECSVDPSIIQGAAGDSEAFCVNTAELEVVSKWKQRAQYITGGQRYSGGYPEGLNVLGGLDLPEIKRRCWKFIVGFC